MKKERIQTTHDRTEGRVNRDVFIKSLLSFLKSPYGKILVQEVFSQWYEGHLKF